MKLPKNYWRLFEVIHQKTTPYLLRTTRPGMTYPAFGLPEPSPVPKAPEPSPTERYWLTWLVDFQEIHASIERLEQSLVYLSNYPGAKAFPFRRLSEADWIRYHVEAYLQETYILQQRLTGFVGRLEKLARRRKDTRGVSMVLALRDALIASFAGIVRARGGHVHQHRFKDVEMSNLELALLLSRGRPSVPHIKAARMARYHEAQSKWKHQMQANNKAIVSAAVVLFDEAERILARNEPQPFKHRAAVRRAAAGKD